MPSLEPRVTAVLRASAASRPVETLPCPTPRRHQGALPPRAAHAEPPQGRERFSTDALAAAKKCSQQPLNPLWALCRARKDLSGMENKDKNQVMEYLITKNDRTYVE